MKIYKVNQVAGSGKTTSLINHIKKNTDKKILFLSFSKMIIEDISLKLNKNNDNVEIHTLHALANKLLKKEFNYEIMAGYDQVIQMIAKKRDKNKAEINQFITFYINQMFDEIEKKLGLKQEFADYLWSEISEGYDKMKKYSFDYLLYVFQKNIYLFVEELTFDMLMIDEAQDLSPIQIEIIKLIIDINKDNSNFTVYIVGDILQNIYKFRYSGADLLVKNITDTDIKTTKSVTYRCPSKIVDIANKVVEYYYQNTLIEEEKPFKSLLVPNSDKVGDFMFFDSKESLLNKLPSKISEAVKSNRKLGILVRNNYNILELLNGIPDEHKDKVFIKEKDIFNSYPVVVFEGIFNLYEKIKNNVLKEEDIAKFCMLIGNYFHIAHKEVFAYIKKNTAPSISFFMKNIKDIITSVTEYKIEKKGFGDFIDSFHRFIKNTSGYEDNKKETESFIKFIVRLNNIDEYNKKKLMVTLLHSKLKDVNVIMMTIHSSKGFEMDDVILYNMGYSIKDDFMEEVKLYYVALTRTKETLEQYGKNEVTGLFA